MSARSPTPPHRRARYRQPYAPRIARRRAGPAQAAGMAFSPSSCVTTPSAVVPGVQIADPACEFNGAAYTAPFSPIANGSGQLSRVWTGIASDGGDSGSRFRPTGTAPS